MKDSSNKKRTKKVLELKNKTKGKIEFGPANQAVNIGIERDFNYFIEDCLTMGESRLKSLQRNFIA